MKKILFIYGTRPEAIKMAPLIKEFQNSNSFEVKVCLTGQHREMLDQINDFFEISSDYDLNVMTKNQTLCQLTCKCLLGLEKIIMDSRPDLIFVQGDTTSVLTGALSAFYTKTKIAHLEAGLRSFNKLSPFPEEVNRKLTGSLADLHFCPTDSAKKNLLNEGIKSNVYKVGNTVIDALNLGISIVQKKNQSELIEKFNYLNFNRKIVLITGHRRESFGEGFENICNAILELSNNFLDVQFVYPVHLNPNIRSVVNNKLKNKKNIFLIEPLDYSCMIWIMSKSFFILTDSGGVQEEAPALGKPVLVMRDVTERQEGIESGTAKLVGTDYNIIVKEATKLLTDPKTYANMANAINPYGDGTTSKQIVGIVKKYYGEYYDS